MESSRGEWELGQEHGAPRISDKTKIGTGKVRPSGTPEGELLGDARLTDGILEILGEEGILKRVWDLCLAIYLLFRLLSVLFFFCFFPVYYDWRGRMRHGDTRVCDQTGLAPQAVNVENTGTEWRSKPGRDTSIAG